jgi:PPM family protein phosphatase
MVVVESAGLTDVGKKRKANEDSLFLDDDLKIYVVADGMGGHQAGEVASGLVVKTMQDYMRRFRNNTDAEELAEVDKTLSKDANRLVSSIHLSNRVVFQMSNNRAAYEGMGSTVSAVLFTDDTVIATNVGDSPIYLIRHGSIQNLAVTHTVLAEQLALHPEGGQQLGGKFSHMLTRAMGIDRTVEPDACELPCFPEDILVLASDGLSDMLAPEEIRGLVQAHRPAVACRKLVDMANERGGNDNITVIVLKIKQVGKPGGGFSGWLARLFKPAT